MALLSPSLDKNWNPSRIPGFLSNFEWLLSCSMLHPDHPMLSKAMIWKRYEIGSAAHDSLLLQLKKYLMLLSLLFFQKDRTDLACSWMERKVTNWRQFNGAPPWCSGGWSTHPMTRPREFDMFSLEKNWIWRGPKSNFPIPMRSTLRWLCQALHTGQVAKGQKTVAVGWNNRLSLHIKNFHTMRTILSQKGCGISTPGSFQEPNEWVPA